MRSADLRAGLTRVVELSEKTFTVRSFGGMVNGWRLLFPAALVLTVLLVATWHAGRGSGQLEAQHVSGELDLLTQKLASTQLALETQVKRTAELEQALQSSGNHVNLALVKQLRQQLLQSQATANQYKTIIDRGRQQSADNQRLVDALSKPGVHVLPFKSAEASADAAAYAFLIENSRLVLTASGLPKLTEDRQFQLWVVRKQDPKFVSAGVFSADENNRALIDFDAGSVLTGLSLLEITEEPQGGSSEPTGPKLLETASVEKSE